MKIHLIKLYKTTILFFLVSGTAVIIGMVILAVASGQVSESGGADYAHAFHFDGDCSDLFSVSSLLEEYVYVVVEPLDPIE